MATQPFSTRPAYLQSIRGLLRLHSLSLLGQDKSPEADEIRDRLGPVWNDLTEAEKKRLAGLSEDLRSLCEPPGEVLPRNAEVQRRLDDTEKAQRSGDWDTALELLRCCRRYVEPFILSSLRRSVWEEAGDHETGAVLDESFHELLDSVCKRPGMYVGRADFDLAAEYLNGFDHGLGAARHELKENGLAGFRQWLAVRLDSCKRSGWPEIIRRENVGPDKFQALARLFDEFARDRRKRGLAAIREEFERFSRIQRDRTCWCESPTPVPAP